MYQPVVNAFLVLMMATSVYAIMGVQLFSEVDTDQFGNFSRAFFTMFQVVSVCSISD